MTGTLIGEKNKNNYIHIEMENERKTSKAKPEASNIKQKN